MGYCIFVKPVTLKIKHADKPAALKAIKALKGKERIDDSSGRHFSWVSHDFEKLKTLEEMLCEWRWNSKIDEDTGDVIGLEFTGEKYGDDDLLFKALAPFIEAGAVIEFRGEDGAQWKYVFDGVTYKEKHSKVVYEE
jgi:hypothetical protein